MRTLLAPMFAFALVSSPAFAEPQGLDVHLSAQDVRDLGPVLDAAIRGSGYSPTAAAALRIGAEIEAAAHAVPSPRHDAPAGAAP